MTSPTLVRSGAVLWGNLIVVYLVWGSTYLAIKFATESVAPLLAIGTRFLAATAIVAVLMLIFRGPSAFRATRAEIGSALLLGVIMLAVGTGTVSFAEEYVPTGIIAIVIAISPLVVVILRALSGDRPRWPTVAGVAVGLGGLAWLLLPGGTNAVSGSQSEVVLWTILVACSSSLWAFGVWLAQRIPTPRDPFTFTTYELFSAGVSLTLVGLLSGERLDVSAISARSWLGWLYLVIMGSVVAYSSFTWLISHSPISLVSTYAYVNPVVAVLLGILFLGESITSDVIIGLTVVLGGVVLVISGEAMRTKTPTPTPVIDT